MTALYRDLLSVISRKRVSDNDSRRLKSFYDKAEQRRIAYALSNVKITEAQISAAQSNLSATSRTTQAQIRALQNNLDEIGGAIIRIEHDKSALTYSWLGNMAASCVSFFSGNVFSTGVMIGDSANAY